MKLTNQQIYEGANVLAEAFANFEEIYLSAKVNFLIQKNLNLLMLEAKNIEEARLNIAKHYGDLNQEQNQYIVSPENIEVASKELAELFNLEQDLDIKKFSIDDLGDTKLSMKAMSALMIMIEEG